MVRRNVEAIVKRFKEIPYEFLTRLAYEATPWPERGYYDRRVMDQGIKPLDPDMWVVGQAYTVNESKMCANVIEEAPEGSVLVVNASNSSGTYVGCLMTKMMQQNKVAGIVIDGYVTHSARVRKMGMPIFCRGATIHYSGYSFEGEVQVPIQCGGVLVNPGDIVLGNADGVIVFTLEEAEKIVVGIGKIMEISRVFIEDYMDKGVRYFDIPDVRDFWTQKTAGDGDEWVLYDKWLKEHGRGT